MIYRLINDAEEEEAGLDRSGSTEDIHGLLG